jgi:hypothetical protein
LSEQLILWGYSNASEFRVFELNNGRIKLSPRHFANRLIYLQLRTRLGKEKRPPEPIPATFALSGSPQWTIFGAPSKLGVSDWVQVPIE